MIGSALSAWSAMGMSLQAVIISLLENAAAFSLAAIAYASLASTTRRFPQKYRKITIGVIFGLTAMLSMTAQHYSDPFPLVTDASMTIVLAAPYGGILAGIVATIMAAVALSWTYGPLAYLWAAQIFMAALMGVAMAEILRRRQRDFRMRQLLLLAVLLPAGIAAVLLPPTADFEDLSSASILSLGLKLPIGTLLFGLLLLRWGDIEKRLWESERRWQALIANVPGVVIQIIVRRCGDLLFPFVSAEATKIFGEAAKDAPDDPSKLMRLIHPEDRGAFRRSLIDAGRVLAEWSHEFRVVEGAGKARWLRGRALPYLMANGNILWDGIIVNITSRKDVEKALRQSEDLYRLLAENTTEIIARIDPEEKWSYVSPPTRYILGYEPGELVGQSFFAIVHGEEIERLRALLKRLSPGGAPLVLTYRARRKDGTYVWVEETRRLAGRADTDERHESISVIRPFHHRRRDGRTAGGEAAKDAQTRNMNFARMLEAASAGVIVTDPHQPDNPIVFANAAATALTGYETSELMGQNCRMFQGADTDREAVRRIRKAISEERSISVTLVNYRKDGTPFWSKLDISSVHGAEGRLEAFVSVFVDVSEQKRLENDLRHARDIAEQANQVKSDFIANISHELRTPLNGVIGFTNLLLNENLPVEQRRYATFARDAGSSLLAIINNVLDLSKIEAGKLDLIETDFSVIELAVSCNTVVWHAAREKNLDLNFVLKPDVVNIVRGDPDRIRQVLLNLLSNAIKFTDKGNVVLSISKVEDSPTDTLLKFSITDTGMGVPKEKQTLLFQKFSQIDEGAGRQLGGTGLGLAICRSLVERMGGTIGVTSTPGVGSKFWFTVPLKAASGAAHRQSQVAVAPHRKASVLLAEDMPMNQELMVTLLRRAGHEVTVVGDGEAAVAAARQGAFDLILMDVQLPRMDGLQATRTIRALEGDLGKVPIVAMTARALSRDVEKCLAAGMNDHLSKPVDAAALLAIIDHWSRTREPQEEVAAQEPATGAAVYDEALLKDLERHLGREKVVHMVAMARDDMPVRLERMRQNLTDFDFVEREAHELVSVAGNLGFMELVQRSRRLMEVCSNHADAQVPSAYAELKSAADRALSFMRQSPLPGPS